MSRYLQPLTVGFFSRPALTVAEALIGHVLVRRTPEGLMAGRIVEAEAYLGADDRASHATAGVTPRTRVMFERAGLAYVFQTRMHYCVNVVTDTVGVPGCVLIRALEPLLGVAQMQANRQPPVSDPRQIASGPGKLCQALRIDLSHYGTDLTDGSQALYIARAPDDLPRYTVVASPRIGISKDADKPYRFTAQGNPHLSRR